MKNRTCLDCSNYSMDCGEETGRMSSDYCLIMRKPLATAAFCFEDVCCPSGAYYNVVAFAHLEKIAKKCPYYEKK